MTFALVLVAPALVFAQARDLEVARLEQAALRYRQIAAHGGWQHVPPGPSIHPGEHDPAIAAVRERLRATGDLLAAGTGEPPAAALADAYDDGLVAAVRVFQRRHGLAQDGVIGARTRAAMNVPIGERIAQLELNRQRVEHEEPPAARYIRVNVPAYRLGVFEGDERVLEMPVVVGRRDRRTPLIESKITWVVFNPTWTIPTKLAYEDVLPKIRRDPDYLVKTGIQVYDGWSAGAAAIDPSWIDWTKVGPAVKRMKLRQAPGDGNPLGRIKFHMVNDYDVYLHDTNHPDLMARDRRDLSSGCIRVGDARALVREVLRDQPGWDEARIAAVIASGETVRVGLRHPMPVRVTYQTAWVEEPDAVQFREDIYDIDARQVAELTAGTRRAEVRETAPATRAAAPLR